MADVSPAPQKASPNSDEQADTGSGGDAVCRLPGRAGWGTIGDWLRLARASNVPTVWTNVVAGAVVAIVAASPRGDGGAEAASGVELTRIHDVVVLDLPMLLLTIVGVSVLYVAGMVLNDVADAPRDAARGMDRPIAAGRVCRTRAGVLAGLGLFAIPVMFALVSIPAALWAAGLSVAIIGYDLLKERFAPAIVLMGVCRALLAPLAGAAQTGTLLDGWTIALGLSTGGYVLLVTIAARGEHDADRDTRRRALMAGAAMAIAPFAALLIARDATGVFASLDLPMIIGFGVAAIAASIVWRGRTMLAASGIVPASIMLWLAALCVIDSAVVLAVIGGDSGVRAADGWVLAAACGASFVLVRRLHRRIAGS